jgi:hypothetical protein
MASSDFYLDAMCSIPYAGDAGTGVLPDAGGAPACTTVVASDYDQSCAVDTDCVAVGEVTQCPASPCDGCPSEAINASAMAKYETAIAPDFASEPSGQHCSCPCEGGAVCRNGKCQAAFCSPPTSDTLPACANTDGMCVYSANTTCDTMGPADACAYADEVCCLN